MRGPVGWVVGSPVLGGVVLDGLGIVPGVAVGHVVEIALHRDSVGHTRALGDERPQREEQDQRRTQQR